VDNIEEKVNYIHAIGRILGFDDRSSFHPRYNGRYRRTVSLWLQCVLWVHCSFTGTHKHKDFNGR